MIEKKIEQIDEFIGKLEPIVESEAYLVESVYNRLITKMQNASISDEISGDASDDEIQDSKCSICFEKYDRQKHQRACITLCGHQFCFACISKLSGTCPTCRKPFKKDKIIKLF